MGVGTASWITPPSAHSYREKPENGLVERSGETDPPKAKGGGTLCSRDPG